MVWVLSVGVVDIAASELTDCCPSACFNFEVLSSVITREKGSDETVVAGTGGLLRRFSRSCTRHDRHSRDIRGRKTMSQGRLGQQYATTASDPGAAVGCPLLS